MKLRALKTIIKDGKKVLPDQTFNMSEGEELDRLIELKAAIKITDAEAKKLDYVELDPYSKKATQSVEQNPQKKENVKVTLEQLLEMSEEEIDALAEKEGIELSSRKQETKAKELFEKIGN